MGVAWNGQGRCWGETGGQAIARILTAIKNGNPYSGMAAQEEAFQKKYAPDFRGAVRRALKIPNFQEHEGAKHGHIALDAPNSSAMGRLTKIQLAGASC
ncbi:MAG: hypothetical protein MR375_01760 [Veillonellaceae bacterium]|nr:hypothetical protein [Veillonellaceae bacterium]